METILSKTVTVATVGGSSGAYTHKLEVIQNKQDNKTKITNFTINGYIKPNHSSWGWSQFYTPQIVLYYTKNGVRTDIATVTVSQVKTSNTSYQLLATKTFDIPHNNDGTLNVTFGYEFTPNTSSYTYLSKAASISGAVVITPLVNTGIIHIKTNGSWKEATPYIKVNGNWKKAIPYIKVNGNWKTTA